MTPRPYRRLQTAAAFAAVYLIWGSTYAAIRIVVAQLPPLTTSGFRFITAGAIMWAIARLCREKTPSLREATGPAISGWLMLSASHGLVCWAEQYVDSNLAAVLMATMPLWMIALDWAVFRSQRPGPLALGAVASGLGGVVLLAPVERDGNHGAVLALVIAPALWAFGALCGKRLASGAGGWSATSIQMLAGGAGLLISGILRGEGSALATAQPNLTALLALGYLVVFGALVALKAYTWLIENVGPGPAATHAFVNPVVALALGSIWLGETLTWRAVAGGGLILAAVLILLAQPKNETRSDLTAPNPPRTLTQSPPCAYTHQPSGTQG